MRRRTSKWDLFATWYTRAIFLWLVIWGLFLYAKIEWMW